ncbi:uncharacterized protein LOC110808888 isoform X2 [Carica papaya]|uniref:uncharacterized protein LOC110808888 isoform X2 n=1 Tax=Carica papaya TaxID=3649 RepID=UPI000B8CF5DB|nr:uncharacterized protein LOC110808888 isoform X2 [Carica papaya]
MKSQHKRQADSSNLSSKRIAKMKSAVPPVRRSERLQNVFISSHAKDIQHVINEVTLSESEEPPLQEGEPMESLEEKVNYLLQKSIEHQEIIEEFKFKVTRDSVFCKSPSAADTRYKKLYINSQKKVESLKDENRELALKLEAALAKVEACEKGATNVPEVLEKVKDMMVVSHLTSAVGNVEIFELEKLKNTMKRAAETAVNVSYQAMQDAIVPPAPGVLTRLSSAKRKRHEESKRV